MKYPFARERKPHEKPPSQKFRGPARHAITAINIALTRDKKKLNGLRVRYYKEKFLST